MASICDFKAKPVISYPIFWSYKVIMLSGDDKKIREILKEKEFKISISKHSKNAKYTSFEVSVLVENENQRKEIFEKLNQISKFVL
ncbi:DUF493 domain-containing protein [Campylobacter sp. FMV-PI01]|uniref:DUF493 domain-containing protein n=1 Tax=Campylobacter portucalensis TaxID=2608384 RepID=A0A6L5WFP6_9BACT|nr:DUF493 domain-containing protein [Campylobacter portucalensis]MSN95910.1 DUF493 domain-containing protein [Campylobacter portucalensis]